MMQLARLGRRCRGLARLAAGAEALAGSAQLAQAGSGASLLLGQAATCAPARWRASAQLRLLGGGSVPAPWRENSSGGSGSWSSISGIRGTESGSGGGSSNSKHASSSRQLTAQIKGAASVQQVLQLVRQAGAHCDSFNFSAAASRVAKLHRQQPGSSSATHEAFGQLLQLAADQQLALNSVAVAQTIYAAAVLQYKLTAQQQLACEKRLIGALGDARLQPQHVANSLWGWSRLGLPLQPRLAAAVEAAVQRTATAMKPQEVANTLWAFAASGWRLSDGAAAALLRRLEAALPDAAPQAVSNSLWAMSKLSLQLDGPLAEAADAAIGRAAEAMAPQNVSNTLWAFASASWRPSDGAAAALLRRLEEMLPDAAPQAVSNSLWAMSKLSLQLDGPLAEAADVAVGRAAAAMTSQAVANTLWAHASSGWHLSAATAASLLQRLEAVLPEAEPQHVSNSLWAMSKLGMQLEGSLATAADTAMQRTAAAMKSQDVCNTLWAFATSGGWRLSDDGAAALLQRLAAVLPKAEPQAVSNSLWAVVELGLQLEGPLAKAAPTLLSSAIAWADARWHEVPALWACDLCYNLARLGARPDSAWIEAAVARCLECLEAGDVDGARFATLVWACSKWQHGLPPAALDRLVPAAVDNVSVDWQGQGRRGGLRLLKALAQQPGGFCAGSAPPEACAALQRLLSHVCDDFELVASLPPEGGELAYLADWAAACAAVGLRLPEPQLAMIQRYMQQDPQQLDAARRADLQAAFEAWGHQAGLELLLAQQLAA